MHSEPIFSIVIPTYNRAFLIGMTMASVLSQEFLNFELIIVDDGSTDGTREVVTRFVDERITYVWNENRERAAARNYGARLARGKYVNFLDSDDLLYPRHLATAAKFIQHSDGDLEVFHLSYDVKDSEGKLIRAMYPITHINQKILDGNMLSCNGMFVRRDIFLEHSFNEDRLMAFEDWELWIRLASRFKIHQVNEVTSTIVLHNLRSVVVSDAYNIKLKTERFLDYVAKDDLNQLVYSGSLDRVRSSAYMYVSLHLAMKGVAHKEVLFYLRKGLVARWQALLTKRFLVILRFLVLRR